MLTTIVNSIGRSKNNNQQYAALQKECEDSVDLLMKKIPGLDARVNNQDPYPYCQVSLPIHEPITLFSIIRGWKLEQKFNYISYSLEGTHSTPWGPNEEYGARVDIHEQSVDIYSHPNYFGEAVELAQRLISKN
jgi:hypothetical protein